MVLKMCEHKFQGILVFCFMSFLVTEIPNMLLNFPFEHPSSSCCFYEEIFAKTGLIVLCTCGFNGENGRETEQKHHRGENASTNSDHYKLQWNAWASKPGLFSAQLN